MGDAGPSSAETVGGVSNSAWVLRLRGPKGFPATLDLPDGPDTNVPTLVELAGKATRVAARRLVLRAGFPPRELHPQSTHTVKDLGIANRDVIHIERRAENVQVKDKHAPQTKSSAVQGASGAAESGAEHLQSPVQAQAAAGQGDAAATPQTPQLVSSTPPPAVRSSGPAAGTPVQTNTASKANGNTPTSAGTPRSATPRGGSGSVQKRRSRVKMPGSGRRLGDGTEETVGTSLGTSGTAKEAAENSLAANLVAAASGGGGTVDSVFKSLRKSLREARTAYGAECEANLKVAAALAGEVHFRPLADGTGRVEVEYKSGPRSTKRELVTDIPFVLLPAILNLVASDTDPVSRNNLKVEAMATVSPRMFWAIVRHGSVGPGKSFHEAMSTLTPQIDWVAIEQRNRHMPERYAEYVRH